ncbi:endomucin [Hippopotamus amphibius kiboko]|uniref:endomucin n=1 Tax=Hippopotamus amphibius kiboko TaxID=575201 RepID=UPI002593D5A8|nr:endomucin [Hippopotamus amphibius kiboko]
MKLLQGTFLCLLLSSLRSGVKNAETSQTTPLSTQSSVITPAKGEGSITKGVTKTEFITTTITVTNSSVSNAVSTLRNSQSTAESPSSIKTIEEPVNTPRSDASHSRNSTLSTISVTSENKSEDTENAETISSSSTSPSYSSIILPVVITLIVITLSVFVLVGLYRMCWKTDPGTPESGNDQPQSDKESVKLLTVKTISHESGEHSAQGKTKN